MFQTSYFASHAPVGRKVCIASKPPRYWQGVRASRLAPSNFRAVNWREAYQNDLESRFPGGAGLREYLEHIARLAPEPILCCYEKDPGDCHRQILAQYAEKWLGLKISEWRDNAPRQMKLL